MDFYLILGVERAASVNEVKRAYTRLARRYHPDINPGDPEAEAFFRQATEAYETLCDAGRREAYDAHGTNVPRAKPASVEFSGFDFSAPVSGASVTFDELFSDVLHDVPLVAGGNPEKGGDLYADVPLGFEEALRGTERRLSVTRLETCAACGGTGARRARESACAHCRGAGTTRWRRGHMVFAKSCTHCGGTGRHRWRMCEQCQAAGAVSTTDEITVQVPAGVANGTRMRVPTKGNVGRHGGEAGDLYITAVVSEHRLFERDGDDLRLDVPITVSEAVLGAEFEVPAVDGRVTVRIPPGTPSGRQFRIAGRGAPSPRTGQWGDLVVTALLTLPRVEDERSRALLREFGRLNAADVRGSLFAE